jgi:hypothetical protein
VADDDGKDHLTGRVRRHRPAGPFSAHVASGNVWSVLARTSVMRLAAIAGDDHAGGRLTDSGFRVDETPLGEPSDDLRRKPRADGSGIATSIRQTCSSAAPVTIEKSVRTSHPKHVVVRLSEVRGFGMEKPT